MPDYNRLHNCLPIKKNLPWLHKQFTQKDKVGIYSILTILFLLKLLQFFCSLWAEDPIEREKNANLLGLGKGERFGSKGCGIFFQASVSLFKSDRQLMVKWTSLWVSLSLAQFFSFGEFETTFLDTVIQDRGSILMPCCTVPEHSKVWQSFAVSCGLSRSKILKDM